MRNVLLLIILTSIFNCSTSDTSQEIPEATVIGRWNLKGFEGLVMFEFTENKRFTLYSATGVFESIDDLIESGRTGNDWYFEGDKITIDLNFGNFSTLTPRFKCDNYVIEWIDDNGGISEIYYREDYDIEKCN